MIYVRELKRAARKVLRGKEFTQNEDCYYFNDDGTPLDIIGHILCELTGRVTMSMGVANGANFDRQAVQDQLFMVYGLEFTDTSIARLKELQVITDEGTYWQTAYFKVFDS